jgi:hypothetical protein
MVAKAKQAETISECKPNPLKENSLNIKMLVYFFMVFAIMY